MEASAGCTVSVVNAQCGCLNEIHQRSSPLSGWYQFGDAAGVTISNRRRVPGEFEDHQYLLLASSSDHCHSKTIARVVRVVRDRILPIVLVNDRFDYEQLVEDLDEFGVDPATVKIVHIPHDSKWTRDFGPTSLLLGTKTRLVDWAYSPDRQSDDDVTVSLANISQTTAEYTPLKLEGGNLLSNGKGVIVTTERFLEQNGEYNIGQAGIELSRQLNASSVVVLEPLVGEDTRHVDMFATFTSPRTIVVGSYDSEIDPVNAAILDRNAQLLSRVRTARGRLRVRRIPMGSREGNCWRTYTNCVYANGVLIVPSYGEFDDPDAIARVLKTYRRLLPGWKVTTVDASDLIEDGGALRCATLNIAKLDKAFESSPNYQLPRMSEPVRSSFCYETAKRSRKVPNSLPKMESASLSCRRQNCRSQRIQPQRNTGYGTERSATTSRY